MVQRESDSTVLYNVSETVLCGTHLTAWHPCSFKCLCFCVCLCLCLYLCLCAWCVQVSLFPIIVMFTMVPAFLRWRQQYVTE